jgi:hypothetical protein
MQAQQRAHWEGVKFDAVMTARTRATVVAASAAMRWGGQTSRPGRWTLVQTTFGPADWQEGRRRGRNGGMTRTMTMSTVLLCLAGRWAEPQRCRLKQYNQKAGRNLVIMRKQICRYCSCWWWQWRQRQRRCEAIRGEALVGGRQCG